MSILLKNIQTVDCHTERRCDVLLKDGIIAELGENITAHADRIIDGKHLTVFPSFVDLHAHFRDPGHTKKEDIHSGCLAAVHGGYTAVNLMPNTSPVCSSMEAVATAENKARELNLCDVYQTVSLTKDFDGATTAHLEDLSPAVQWVTDDGNGIDSTAVMLTAIEIATRKGFGLMLHEEDRALTPLGTTLAEDLPTYRDTQLALLTGAKLHFCHVSTSDSIDFIAKAKKQGANITCEVTPHHLYFNDENAGRVAPPLRAESHRQALLQAVKRGVVDAIATDHAPHTPADKARGMNGFSGIDIAFSASYTVLVRQHQLPLTKLSALLSKNPAALLNRKEGEIIVGAPANLTVINLEKSFVVGEQDIISKSKNTPFLGETLYGEIRLTLKKGSILYEKGDN